LTRPNSLSFAPRGLNILTQLADLTDVVREKIRILIEARDNPPKFHESFDGDSPIKSFLAELKAETDIQFLEQRSVLTQDEVNKIDELEKELAKLKLLDPLKEIERRQQEKRDLESLLDSIALAQTALGESSELEIVALVNDVLARREEVEQSGAKQFQTDHF